MTSSQQIRANVRGGVYRSLTLTLAAVICLLTAITALAGEVPLPSASPLDDSASAAATVTAYHRALAAGDSATALSLLTDDALILESGGIETREEYRSHHLSSDIQFAQAVRTTRDPVQVRVRGDVAWAASSSIAQGQFRGRGVNSAGAELMVLTRLADGWKIAAIHWSSRSRRP